MTIRLDLVRCACGRCLVLSAGDQAQWPGDATRRDAVALAALRCDWLYYASTSAWSCPACVARSDAASPVYREAARRKAERVRGALAL